MEKLFAWRKFFNVEKMFLLWRKYYVFDVERTCFTHGENVLCGENVFMWRKCFYMVKTFFAWSKTE